MKYFGLTINLKDDPAIIEKYKACHREVWPEVLADARRKGLITTRIFLLGRHLFMYVEAKDDFDLYQSMSSPDKGDPRLQEWDDIMRGFQEKVPEAGPDEWWAAMELVFDWAIDM